MAPELTTEVNLINSANALSMRAVESFITVKSGFIIDDTFKQRTPDLRIRYLPTMVKLSIVTQFFMDRTQNM